jgi:hypothetical protein
LGQFTEPNSPNLVQHCPFARAYDAVVQRFRRFPRLARFMNSFGQEPREAVRKKGNRHMFGSSIKRTIIAISAALTVSAVAVGATISPAQAGMIQASEVARG